MILAAGLTPAWQHVLVFDALQAGEVNRAVESHWCASGKVINVGAMAHLLGAEAKIVTVGGGAALRPMCEDLARLGAACRWVETRAATRVCTTIVERQSGQVTELAENGLPLSASELSDFAAAFAQEAAAAKTVVFTGSLPTGTPARTYRGLLGAASCPLILDFRGPGLLDALELKPLLVKPNRQELAETLGQPLATDADLLAGMRSLCQRGAQWVLVTQGRHAAWLCGADGVWQATPLRMAKVVNTIGCGDALTAGLACGIARGLDVPSAVRFGLAAAADKTQHVLPREVDREVAERLVAEVTIERLH